MTNLRTGIGYDVHKLVPYRKLVLGGVEVSNTVGALGFSDADVLIHAIADALLGAASLGDIGLHFPETDLKNKGLSGKHLLADVANLIEKDGFTIVNVDSTVILQTPKINEYILQMRNNISSVLGLDLDRVSVKATTTDRLGFTGREEGIAAEAIALLSKK
jgi:2-C-methyl-D-erythritol 2,4-cyclodiphosphate synthase